MLARLRRRRPAAWIARHVGRGPLSDAGRARLERFKGQELRELVRVIAVGDVRRIGRATLTLLSLERYTDGFLAHWSIVEEVLLVRFDGGTPEFDGLVARDDAGREYVALPHGGGGGGGHRLISWRFAHRFAPALPDDARTVTIEVPRLVWCRWEQHPGGDRVLGGPWQFVVPLA